MLLRQRLVTYGIPTIAAATIAVAAGLTPWSNPATTEPVAPTPTERPDPDAKPIDVVFAVDTTASMGKLLDGAKRTVWSIANHIRQSDPHADLRVGLVGYKDTQGSRYVTRPFALTGDLDAMYVELSGYTAEGGGDIPEDVAAGMYDSIYKMQWRDGARKIIFVVGDAPPADRGDVPRFDVLAREAGDRQIIVNTIRCGQDPETAQAFQEIAALGHGEFSTVRQDGGVQELATPYDNQIAELSSKIDHTAVIMGQGARTRHMGKMAAADAAPAEAKADRAGWYAAKKGAPRDEGDAVAAVAGGTMSIDAVRGTDLPAELQGMTKEKLTAELARRADERKAAQKQLDELVAKRADYLKTKSKDGSGFDDMVKKTVDRELAR